MRFLNPDGLWLLLGIPVLIIIYLIKSQHEERAVSSTFIWRLSAKFMKKRLPLQKIRKLLVFLMQLLIITALALCAARPAISDGEACDYIFIIDASASMNIADENGVTRFDRAVMQTKQLSSVIDKGHTVSIILASDSASFLIQGSKSQNEINLSLETAKCMLGDCDVGDAVSLAEMYCENSGNYEVVLFTDREYEAENIEVVNLNQSEWNVSILSLVSKKSGKNTVFTGKLISSNRDSQVAVGLKIDGKNQEAIMVSCAADEETEFSFEIEGLSSFDYAEAYTDAKDALEADNSYAVCHSAEKTYSVLLVSQSPLYLESALEALGNCKVTVVSEITEENLTGHDLYVFDEVFPSEYPSDGAVIQFGVSVLPEGISADFALDDEAPLSKVTGKVHDFYENLVLDETVVKTYAPLIGNVYWESFLICGDSTVCAARRMSNGMNFTVISFDLHDSNLPMQMDYVALVKNLVEYSVPGILRGSDYSVGESVEMNVLPSAELMYVEYPDDSVRTLSTSLESVSIVPDKVGVYTAVMTNEEGGEYADFFVHIPAGETQNTDGGALRLDLSAKIAEENEEKEDALSELWFWIIAAVLVIILSEWGVYYYEQY